MSIMVNIQVDEDSREVSEQESWIWVMHLSWSQLRIISISISSIWATYFAEVPIVQHHTHPRRWLWVSMLVRRLYARLF
jgi:hypothetical protein